MKRALSSTEFLRKKYDLFEFEGVWKDAFSCPETAGIWFVWGASGSGKTTFTLSLAKYLSQFSPVLYNSLEEGGAHTLQEVWKRVNVSEVGNRVQLLEAESMHNLDKRLQKRESRNIVFIDSLQYTGFKFPDYVEFVKKYPKKLFIFTSHAKGKSPVSRTGEAVMFDAGLKIWIEGHKAFSKGRYIGATGEYTIWDEGAEKYWGNP